MGRPPRRIVFDIETDQFSDTFYRAETDQQRRKHAPKMRVACIFDEAENAHRFYTARQAKQLVTDLLAADEIVSFNGKRFDLLVLQRHYALRVSRPVPKKGTHVDMHEIMSSAAGFRVSLDRAVRLNFDERKHTDGRDMGALSLEQLKVACRSDVMQTYRLWQAHVSGRLRTPIREARGGFDSLDDIGPGPGEHMPDLCPACHDVGSLVFEEADASEMTEGQLANYDAGMWGYATCLTCGHYDYWEA